MKKFLLFFAGFALLSLCSCVGPRIEVSVSPDLIKQYGDRCPSLEVDVAVTGGDEAKRAELADMNAYFEPDNVIRTALMPETLCFSAEQTETQVIGRDAPCWSRWREKSWDKIILFVNLPIPADPKLDGRRISVPFSYHFLYGGTVSFKITPAGLVQVR